MVTHDNGHTALVDANVRMSAAIFQARFTLPIISGIPDKKRETLLALRAHSVVVAFETNVQFIRPRAIAMTIALALDRAIGSNIAKLTKAYIWLYACPPYAALRANGYADVSKHVIEKESISISIADNYGRVERILGLEKWEKYTAIGIRTFQSR